jgi:uncharacterized protein with ParB-like and HNH nuclease domain
MGSIANNIQAETRSLKDMLHEKKYHVDYFQREYKWQAKHVEQLLVDLEATFIANYNDGDLRQSVDDYNCYYLGPIVISQKNSARSIVDGQQRLTTMTLLLIYLNKLQKLFNANESLDDLIYSTKYGKKSYNIEVPDRSKVLDKLFFDCEIDDEDLTDESVFNMLDRYKDIDSYFPDSLKSNKDIGLMFIDWIKEKVIFVEIVAHSDENAYTIFETMNDRGLNLTPTEMLKGYLLTNVKDDEKIKELNDLWKSIISEMHAISIQEDLEFFKAWLRSQYADSLRGKMKGSGNEDFEKIGTKFHTWVKDNHKRLLLKQSDDFYFFIKSDLSFYSKVYLKIIRGMQGNDTKLYDLYLHSHWSIALSLSIPLYMASVNKLDDEATIVNKLKLVSIFIDIYTVYRSFCGSSITQSVVRYFIYTVVKDVRNKSLEDMADIFYSSIKKMSENLLKLESINIYNYSDKFIKYVFSRIVYYVEREYGNEDIQFNDLIAMRKRNRYKVERIIPVGYMNLEDNFDDDALYRQSGRLGNFVYVKNTVTQAMDEYLDIRRLSYLVHENIFSSSASQYCLDGPKSDLMIKEFTAENIELRTLAVTKIIKEIWNPDILLEFCLE